MVDHKGKTSTEMVKVTQMLLQTQTQAATHTHTHTHTHTVTHTHTNLVNVVVPDLNTKGLIQLINLCKQQQAKFRLQNPYNFHTTKMPIKHLAFPSHF